MVLYCTFYHIFGGCDIIVGIDSHGLCSNYNFAFAPFSLPFRASASFHCSCLSGDSFFQASKILSDSEDELVGGLGLEWDVSVRFHASKNLFASEK